MFLITDWLAIRNLLDAGQVIQKLRRNDLTWFVWHAIRIFYQCLRGDFFMWDICLIEIEQFRPYFASHNFTCLLPCSFFSVLLGLWFFFQMENKKWMFYQTQCSLFHFSRLIEEGICQSIDFFIRFVPILATYHLNCFPNMSCHVHTSIWCMYRAAPSDKTDMVWMWICQWNRTREFSIK